MDFSYSMALAALLVGLSKGGLLGPAGGALVLPLLSQTMSVSDAAGITLPLLIFADLLAMRFFWKQWDLYYIRLMMPMTIVGVFFGTFLLSTLSDDVLRRLLGVMTLAIVIYKYSSDRLKSVEYKHQSWHGFLAGWSSGFASSLANVGGPPITAYLLLQKLKPMTFVGTITFYFFVLNIIKVPGFLGAGIIKTDLLAQIIWVLPIIVLGVWLGRLGILRFDPKRFDIFMTILLIIAALTLLF